MWQRLGEEQVEREQAFAKLRRRVAAATPAERAEHVTSRELAMAERAVRGDSTLRVAEIDAITPAAYLAAEVAVKAAREAAEAARKAKEAKYMEKRAAEQLVRERAEATELANQRRHLHRRLDAWRVTQVLERPRRVLRMAHKTCRRTVALGLA